MTDKDLYLESIVQKTRQEIDKIQVPEIKGDYIFVLNNLKHYASYPEAYDEKEALGAINRLCNMARSYNALIKNR